MVTSIRTSARHHPETGQIRDFQLRTARDHCCCTRMRASASKTRAIESEGWPCWLLHKTRQPHPSIGFVRKERPVLHPEDSDCLQTYTNSGPKTSCCVSNALAANTSSNSKIGRR